MERKLPQIGEKGTFDDLIAIAAIQRVEREGLHNAAYADIPFEPSKRLKRIVNLYFRLYCGKNTLMHPEVDNVFQRIRYRYYVIFKPHKKRINRK